MKNKRNRWLLITVYVILHPIFLFSQPLKTPLSQEVLNTLTNEISGQMIYNNEVLLAGAPWVRNNDEFKDTFYESEKMFELVKYYGIETTELQRYPGKGLFEYPSAGEFWVLSPQKRQIARIGADAALIVRGSQSVDVTGELIYLPPLQKEKLDSLMEHAREKYKGKIALMWSHPRGNLSTVLDSLGIRGVVSFSSRDRYLDPNQVVYGRGAFNGKNLRFGFNISWRQWSELLEDVEGGKKPIVRCKTKIEKYDNKFETVFSWIPGTEPDKKGVVFTGHLFEGYTKRGANDDMSGCVVQLEILRTLTKLIKEGILPQPRRTIYFIWPNEISGTYEFFKQNPGFIDKLSININMDMVGEALRKNNGVFTMSECPSHLPSYLDGLAKSMMNYVWRTNDIVYLPDSPRGRPGGQYFPIPMMEKNGSTDAFRFYIHRATGGSDHICFNNPSVAVPAIELFTWPDQWYHADTDNPDKSDPTEMKRVAFIGAASAYAAANCTDEVLSGLLEAVSDFGYSRFAERVHPIALKYIENATKATIDTAVTKALNLINFGIEREIAALKSIEEIYSGSRIAGSKLEMQVKQWELYGKSLQMQALEFAKVKAKQLKTNPPKQLKPSRLQKKYSKIFPKIHPNVRGKDFYVNRSEKYTGYLKEHPDALKEIKLSRSQYGAILNFVNGRNSITKIHKNAEAETGSDISFEQTIAYLDFLKKIGWIEF